MIFEGTKEGNCQRRGQTCYKEQPTMNQEVHVCPDGSGLSSEHEICNEHKRLGAGWAHKNGITGKAEQSQSP